MADYRAKAEKVGESGGEKLKSMKNDFLSVSNVVAEGQFNHIGYASVSIENELNFFRKLGYEQEGESFVDLTQGVKGCFLTGIGPRIELLENLPGSKTLTPWLNQGIKMYHFAFEVNDLFKTLEKCKEQRARIVVEPVSAVAFGGRHISFVLFRTGQLVEFIGIT